MFKPEISLSINSVESLGLKDGVYKYRLNPNYENALKEFKKQGINSVEIGVFVQYAWEFEKYSVTACEIAEKHGIKINSVHFSFGQHWQDLASVWEADRQEIIKWTGKMLAKLDAFNIRAYVFHPTPVSMYSPEQQKDRLNLVCDSADKIAEYAKGYVCIENMASGLMSTLGECLYFINHTKKAQMVADVNHFLSDNPAEALAALGNRVKTLHISDNDGVKERHWLPGEGKIDFAAVISALEKTGYEGRFNYEVLGKYTPYQVKENYQKLFK